MSEATAPAHRLSTHTRMAIEHEVNRYPDSRSSIIPALRLAQCETGWLSADVIDEVADLVGEDPNMLVTVASFYDMFYLKPVGRYVINCCSGFACYLNGADALIDHLINKLGIGVGETTPDGLFTLQPMECLAGCGIAPMLLVNGTYHGNLTPGAIDRIIDDLKSEAAANTAPVRYER